MNIFLNILATVGVSAFFGLLFGAVSVFGKKEQEEEVQLSLDCEEIPSEETGKVAFVRCSGHEAERKFTYAGAHDCLAASMLAGGDRACEFSCLGFGSCAQVCKKGAVSVKNGVSEVDEDRCDGCGECVKICPRGIISLIPKGMKHKVRCSNEHLGSQTRKLCEVGCIGCHTCEKTCKYGAAEVEESLAQIDYSKCTGCGECAEACPRGIITAPPAETAEEPFDESEYFSIDVDVSDEGAEEAGISSEQ